MRAGRRASTWALTLVAALLAVRPVSAQTPARPQLGPAPPTTDAPPQLNPTDPAGTVTGSEPPKLNDQQAEVSARYVKQDDRTKTVFAEGDLRVVWRTWTISGQRALFEQLAGRVTLTGPTRATKADGTTITAEAFTLHPRKNWVETGPFQAVLPPEVVGYGTAEPINIWGHDSLAREDHYFAAHEAWLSGCSPSDLKYALAAKTIAVVPNKKLILRSAKAYLFGVPIFAWGKLTLPLRRCRRSEWLPEFGRNDTYGVYTRMRYFYDLADSQYGNVSGMMTEKRGAFLGLEHDYGWGRGSGRGQGQVDLEYGTRNAELSLRGDLQQALGADTALRANGSFSQNSGFSSTSLQSNYTSTLTHTFDLGSTIFGYNRSESRSGAQSSNFTRYTFSQRLNLGPIFGADLNADYSRRQSSSQATDHELETRLKFNGRWTLFDWELTDQRRFDIEGSKFAADDNRPVTEIVPQLSLTTDSRRLGARLGDLVDLRLTTNIGQYREFITPPGGGTASRSTVLRANFDVQGSLARVNFGPRTRFLTDFRYSQSIFDHPDPAAKYVVAVGPTFEMRPFANTRFDLRYRWQEVAGYSPLSRFDFEQTINDFDYTASFFLPDRARPRNGVLALTFNGGYDLLRGAHRDLRIGARIQPLDPLLITLNTSYALDSRGFGDVGFRSLRGEISYDGGRRYQHQIGFTYDSRNGKLQNVDSLLTIEPLPRISVQNALTFDGDRGRVSFNDILLTYDLGCVQLLGTYRQQAKEFRVDINLTAFPGLASLFGTGRFGQQFSTSQGFQF
ncbi:MAG: hypothetical protein IT204_23040 [Fimbriimonadaceae bacterium]|nr:hypothetical protein [Fimbriimonadaceae bacterium]